MEILGVDFGNLANDVQFATNEQKSSTIENKGERFGFQAEHVYSMRSFLSELKAL